ncbi:MAG: NAD(P)H-hydrate dehydratase [Candidatus Omnitrophica bacterium]|nr:NAD(P)H-hydrate dehydratase [Candidatus Omnitrophota bacterium]
MKPALPKRLLSRRPGSHKGDYGHVLVIGGAVGYVGAPILCVEAALRSGAGLVSLAVSKEIYPIAACKAPPEIMVHPTQRLPQLLQKADVIALGPGLSRAARPKALVRRLVRSATQPMVVDADGIIALKGLKKLSRPSGAGGMVLTPHPGEMANLLGTAVSKVQANRKKTALQTAKRLNAVVVLKGHKTIVASPVGRTYLNSTGNPGMATAGMGDVLTGVIAALIGQGCDPFTAARAGVYLHGLAGDLAAKEVGETSLTAGDVLRFLPAAFRRVARK